MPPKKKARTGVRKSARSKTAIAAGEAAPTTSRVISRGRRPNLANILDLPLDVVLEVFSHLEPRDLCSLVRTNKAVRDFLLNRHLSNAIWRGARERLESLPARPHFLTEPAYAHFLFSNHCHSCGKGPVYKILFPWFKRYCNKCMTKGSVRLCTISLDEEDFFTELEGDEEEVLNVVEPSGATDGTLDAKTVVYEAQKARVAEMEELAGALEDWCEEQKRLRTEELEALRTERFNQICERLISMGKEAQLQRIKQCPRRLEQLIGIASVRQAAPLTDKGFEKVWRDIGELFSEGNDIHEDTVGEPEVGELEDHIE
ncbi:hypothetical protein ONZ51_g1311 [Trametes cubensis]|uniref:F-box domain-containing protein n=1 Tax=Trametes cubensis TaxID=1111947 RepID=A0AAD7U1N8_9APHY|nr:hypothetical protein ONZ51_g1311 [Trametes cubensis]